MASTLHWGVVRGTTTCAVTPLSCAASATACPWLPELCVTTPCALQKVCNWSVVAASEIACCSLLRGVCWPEGPRAACNAGEHCVDGGVHADTCHEEEDGECTYYPTAARQWLKVAAACQHTCRRSASERLSMALSAPRNLNAPLHVHSHERQQPDHELQHNKRAVHRRVSGRYFPLACRCGHKVCKLAARRDGAPSECTEVVEECAAAHLF